MGRLGFRLIGGVFSSDAKRSIEYGKEWGVPGFESLECLRKADAAFRFAIIATPNNSHLPIAKELLRLRKPFLLEKPITLNLPEARELRALASAAGVPVGVAYTYPGYWAPSLASLLVRAGRLGRVRSFVLTYLQGWQVENLGIAQEWRQKREVSGDFNCLGDIGTHLVQLLRYITGEELKSVACMANSFGAGRALDDDAHVLATLSGGGNGVLKASQIACGHENDIGVQIFCERGSLDWRQEDPEVLNVHLNKKGTARYVRGANLSQDELAGDLFQKVELPPLPPGGHVAGFREALGAIQWRFSRWVEEWERAGRASPPPASPQLPTLDDGLAGMKFLAACKESLESRSVRLIEVKE